MTTTNEKRYCTSCGVLRNAAGGVVTHTSRYRAARPRWRCATCIANAAAVRRAPAGTAGAVGTTRRAA